MIAILILLLIGLCIFIFFYYNKKISIMKKQIYTYAKTIDSFKEKKYSDKKQDEESKE